MSEGDPSEVRAIASAALCIFEMCGVGADLVTPFLPERFVDSFCGLVSQSLVDAEHGREFDAIAEGKCVS